MQIEKATPFEANAGPAYGLVRIEPTGRGKFKASNGRDELTADYVPGVKSPEVIKPHWDIKFNGRTITVQGDKDACIAKVYELLCAPAQTPMPEADACGNIHGIVRISIQDLLQKSESDIRQILAGNITKTPEKLKIRETIIVGANADQNEIWLRVSGHLPE